MSTSNSNDRPEDLAHRQRLRRFWVLGVFMAAVMFGSLFIGGAIGGEAWSRRWSVLIVGGGFTTLYLVSTFYIAPYYGYVEIIRIGKVYRKDTPVQYWVFTFLGASLFLAFLAIGIYLAFFDHG